MDVTLRHGDKNQQVSMLQKALNNRGAKLYVDGEFGDATEAAVIAFQKANNLIPDGIAGRQTWQALNGEWNSKSLTFKAVTAAAKKLDVTPAAILAITEVEASGDGFLPNGKPDVLFERHIMYRHLCIAPAGDDEEKYKAAADNLVITNPNLVNPRPGGYAGGTTEWHRLSRARLIDDTCALNAASWGMFQIMGFHWQRLGYASVQDFADDMHTDEDAHLSACCRFIESDDALHKALKGQKWAQFARIYNGPNYARNHYDVKLATAFKHHTATLEQTS